MSGNNNQVLAHLTSWSGTGDLPHWAGLTEEARAPGSGAQEWSGPGNRLAKAKEAHPLPTALA